MMVQTHHFNLQTLATLAVIWGSTDEEERPWPVELEHTMAIVEGNNRFASVTVIVTPLFYFNN